MTAESASARDAYCRWPLVSATASLTAGPDGQGELRGNPKVVCYLSAESHAGRQLRQNALYAGTADLARQAVAASGFTAWDLESVDVEPGLGNGGAWAAWPPACWIPWPPWTCRRWVHPLLRGGPGAPRLVSF
jgi:glycogen phosphorylase